jgi:nucleoside triphosphate pyrophosphatase
VAPTNVILASRSPQRKALLKALGIDFRTIPAEVEERTEGAPQELVLANALVKARAIAARRRRGTLVIAGDTEVVVDGRALGQPGFEGEARWCLETLSGRTHEVLGALALIGPDRVDGELEVRTGVESSLVTFGELAPKLIDSYLASGEWKGRAGGYAVQGLGSALVAGIEGDVSNVIGLPVGLLLRLAPELAAE